MDDAWHQREPAGIDDLGGVPGDVSDRGDAAITDRDIGVDRIVPESIHHNGAADYEVTHRHLLCSPGNTLCLA